MKGYQEISWRKRDVFGYNRRLPGENMMFSAIINTTSQQRSEKEIIRSLFVINKEQVINKGQSNYVSSTKARAGNQQGSEQLLVINEG